MIRTRPDSRRGVHRNGEAGRAVGSAALATLLAAVVSGCLDFVEPEPRPPRLQVALTVEDGDSPTARLLALLAPVPSDPGGGGPGDPGPIRIWDRAIYAAETGDEFIRWDAEWIPRPAHLQAPEVVVVPPDLPGLAGSPLRLPLVWRAGSDSVTADDAGVLLRLRSPPATADSARFSWTLRVLPTGANGSGRGAVQADGRGPPPDSIRIPPSLLPAGSEPLEARLDVRASTPFRDALRPGFHFSLRTGIAWSITR